MDYSGEKFLDKLYRDLYLSDEVKHTSTTKDYKEQSIKKYLDRIEKLHNKTNTQHKKELLKELYYIKYVIKEDEIINLSKKERMQIINNQKNSLSHWIDYLMDNNPYPMWAKYWAFQGMLKMGTYDSISETYQKRSNKTTSGFIDVNSEIINNCMQNIIKLVGKEKIEDEELNKILKTGSFSKLYMMFEKKYKKTNIKNNNIDGVWIKYNQGNKEDAVKLCKSLLNKNTGWCTCDIDIAFKQICGPYKENDKGGDFYVYYTKDIENNYTIPRIAIRMDNNNKIGEIRGIEFNQALEDIMIPVLEKKLNQMTFVNKKYINENIEIINDLKYLSNLNKKVSKNIELTDEEINNLYSKKYGFGHSNDSKIEKIISKRDISKDINKIKDIEVKADIYYKYLFKLNTKEEVFKAIEEDKYSFKYASDELKDDYDLVLKIIKKYPFLIKYASDRLRNNKNIGLEVIKRDNISLMYLGKNLINDYEIVNEAIKINGTSLHFASKELQNDKELVLKAIKVSSEYFTEATDKMQNDYDVALEAVKQDGRLLRYVGNKLKNNENIVLEALKQNIIALEFANDKYKNDINIIKEGVKKDGRILVFTSEEIRDDGPIVLDAVRTNGEALEYASEYLKNDRTIVYEAVKNNYEAINFIGEELKKNKEFMLRLEEFRKEQKDKKM